MFDFNIALQSLVGLIAFLVLLFLFLLGYTFWTRKKQQYWNRYEEKFRDYFFSLLLDYVEQSHELAEVNADDIIHKISRRTKDYSFFIKLLNELDNILDGTERERLTHLIQHHIFESFYKKKLFELSSSSKIYACIYFQNSGNINDRILAKLITVSKSSNLKLAYAATKALQSAEDWTVRKNAMLRFFQRNDISELMIAELLHLFDSGLAEDRPQIAQSLKDLLLKDLDSEAKHIIVSYMGFQQFYECSDFLLQYLKRLHYNPEKESLTRALIIALGELYYTEAAPIIRHYTQKGNQISIRLAGVKSLSIFGGEENLTFLLQNLIEAPFPIRKAIIYELITRDNQHIPLLTKFVKETTRRLKKIQQTSDTHREITSYLDKVSDISSGIKIVLNHRRGSSYA